MHVAWPFSKLPLQLATEHSGLVDGQVGTIVEVVEEEDELRVVAVEVWIEDRDLIELLVALLLGVLLKLSLVVEIVGIDVVVIDVVIVLVTVRLVVIVIVIVIVSVVAGGGKVVVVVHWVCISPG